MNKDLGHKVTPIIRRQSITTGTNNRGCKLRFGLFTPTLLSLHIEGTSERTPVPLLTREAAVALRAQLDDLIPQLLPSSPESDSDEGECARSAA